MIRIDTKKIEKWDEIKENHLKAVKSIVKQKIEKLQKKGKLNDKTIDSLKKLLGLKIIKENNNLKVEFKNDKEIEIFALGRIDDICVKFEKEDFLKLDDSLKLELYIKKIEDLIEQDGLKGNSNNGKEERKKLVKDFLDNNKEFAKEYIFNEKFIDEYITTDNNELYGDKKT